MAMTPGRTRRRSTGGVNALIQARVDLEVKALADKCAAAAGLSIARYVETLIQADAVARGFAPQPAELEAEQEQLDIVEKRAS